MSTKTTLYTRIIPSLLMPAMALSMTACSPSSKSAANDTSANTTQSSPSGAPTYERKRGETPEILVEELSDHAQSGSYTSNSLPVTMVFHDVRGGEHEDFYRVVIEFKRDKNPEKRPETMPFEYAAQWVDSPISQGKGAPLANSATSFLDVIIPGTTMPEGELESLYYTGDKNLTFGPIDVSIDGAYEGNTHVVIGMDKQRQYGMTVLEGPTRLVVDIKK